MTPQERTLLEGLMFGLGVPPSSARRPSWMDDAACLEHHEVEFIPANPLWVPNDGPSRSDGGGTG